MAETGGSLHAGLKQRHLTMIAIGGVIRAGLFVGSSAVIGEVGPLAFLTYAVTGILIVMVMRMLGEMAAANPSTGSFTEYARLAMGDWAGFTAAWLYWYFWVIVVGFEAVAGAAILQKWLPGVPLWAMALGLMMLMTASNLFSVKSFGEFEYWFAGIKVAAIIAFLLIGGAYVFGLWPGKGPDFSNLSAGGNYFPHGTAAIFSGIVVVVFSMVGAEIATIAAAESEDPANAIVKATRSVVIRIMIFYVGAIFLLTCILPWNSLKPGASPFVAALEKIGLPGTGDLMNAIVLTAVLSCLNSGLYTASRMLFVLANRNEAPAALTTTTASGVPARAIIASTMIGYLAVIAAYISPDTVFSFLLNSSGAIILFVYLMIAVSQLILRPKTPPERLKIKMWFFPVLTILTIAGMLAVLVMMAFRDAERSQLLLSLFSAAFVVGTYFVFLHPSRRAAAQEA